MADSLPGTISLFSEAYAELMNTGETGQAAQARFYQDIATGSIVSAEILPIFARLASERAQPKLGVMKTMSIAEQGRFGSSLSDLLITGSESGVEEGFAEFWRSMTRMLQGAQPIVRGLAGTFRELTFAMRPISDIFVDLNAGLEKFSEFSGIAEGNMLALVGVGAAMLTKWGRLGVAMLAVAAVFQDISWGVQGKGESVTGTFFDALEGWGVELGTFEKTVLGVAGAVGTLVASLKMLQGLGRMGGLLGGGGRTPPSTTSPTTPTGGRSPTSPTTASGGSWNAPRGARAPFLSRIGMVPKNPIGVIAGATALALGAGPAADKIGDINPFMDLMLRGTDSAKGVEWFIGKFLESQMFKPSGQEELKLMMRELGGDVLPFDPEYTPRHIRRMNANWGTPLVLKPEEYINYSNEVNGEHTLPPFKRGHGGTSNVHIDHKANVEVKVSVDLEDLDSARNFFEVEFSPLLTNVLEEALVQQPIGE